MAFEFLGPQFGFLFQGALFPLAVGLGSSFTHCAGMCGPIHFFLASQKSRSHSVWLYHLGRISGYTLIGAVLGTLSQVFTGLSSINFRLTAGVLLAVLYSIFGLGLLGWLPSSINLEKNLGFLFPAKLFAGISKFGSRPQLLFPAGLLASLLPCPSTHAVMLWSMGLSSPWKAAGSMSMLGVATLPVFMVIPARFFSRPAWSGRFYQGLLGVVFLGLSAWRIYGLATKGPGSCH